MYGRSSSDQISVINQLVGQRPDLLTLGDFIQAQEVWGSITIGIVLAGGARSFNRAVAVGLLLFSGYPRAYNPFLRARNTRS